MSLALAEQQRVFWESVRTTPGPAALDDVFVSRGALSAQQRMEIYRTAYWVRQVSALRELFPSVVARAGDARFAQWASRFIAEQPSKSWALEYLGPPFVAWLRKHEPEVGAVAAIDWVRFEVFIAPNVVTLKREALSASGLEAVVLRVGPHVAWCAGSSNEVVCAWRTGFTVMQCLVDREEARALEAAREGVSFSTWCQLVSGDGARGPEAVLAIFERWLSREWLVNA